MLKRRIEETLEPLQAQLTESQCEVESLKAQLSKALKDTAQSNMKTLKALGEFQADANKKAAQQDRVLFEMFDLLRKVAER